MTQEIIDEEDWVEIDRGADGSRNGTAEAEVTVKVTVAAMGRSGKSRARTYITFRNKAAEWIVEHGPRFRVAVGGSTASYIRIVPDLQAGKFEWGETARRGTTKRLNLGCITAWPPERRDLTVAKWDTSRGYMVIRLPDDWARPRAAKPPASPSPPSPTAGAAGADVAVAQTDVAAVTGRRRVTVTSTGGGFDYRQPLHDITAKSQGDPPPGRSVLDKQSAR